jgi:hypothetical protein
MVCTGAGSNKSLPSHVFINLCSTSDVPYVLNFNYFPKLSLKGDPGGNVKIFDYQLVTKNRKYLLKFPFHKQQKNCSPTK